MEQKGKRLDEFSVTELKAASFDIIQEIQKNQQILQQVSAQLQKKVNEQNKSVEAVKNDSKPEKSGTKS